MNLIARIKALSLLFLMLGMMAHGAIPHIHHDHKVEHDHHGTDLAEHHHHEHSDNENSGHDHEHSLLVRWMETHSHESHVHEFVQLEFTAPTYVRIAVNFVTVVAELTESLVIDIDEERNLFQAYRSLHYHDPDLLPYSLRGPPVLG